MAGFSVMPWAVCSGILRGLALYTIRHGRRPVGDHDGDRVGHIVGIHAPARRKIMITIMLFRWKARLAEEYKIMSQLNPGLTNNPYANLERLAIVTIPMDVLSILLVWLIIGGR